jgi:hypothetical protein
MRNFSRVLRLALRYRLTLMASLVCALGVAILWGMNIGTIYPFVKVAFQRKSLQDWIDEELTKSQQAIDEKAAQITRYESLLALESSQQVQSLRQWIDAEGNPQGPGSVESAERLRQYRALLALGSSQRQRDLQAEIHLARSRVAAEREALRLSRRLQPY